MPSSIVFAERFKGMEISSIQALKAADINFGEGGAKPRMQASAQSAEKEARRLMPAGAPTLQEQSDDWKKRSLFERQWVIRDFRKTAGMSVDEWLEALEHAGSKACRARPS